MYFPLDSFLSILLPLLTYKQYIQIDYLILAMWFLSNTELLLCHFLGITFLNYFVTKKHPSHLSISTPLKSWSNPSWLTPILDIILIQWNFHFEFLILPYNLYYLISPKLQNPLLVSFPKVFHLTTQNHLPLFSSSY